MSRQSMAPQRNLSLTEELEKLEQSITLTLQEIDHNFSRAHRIVTTSILPIVEQYGKHSEAVWEGSKFWKQFFEASANVSLSGYEARDTEDTTVNEDTQQSQTYEEETMEEENTVTGGSMTPPRPTSSQAGMDDETSEMDSPSLAHAHSTPRAPNTGGKEPAFADFSSPYETLREEIRGTRTPKLLPTTPRRTSGLPDMVFDSSPLVPPTSGKAGQAMDPLLHRVLDKTYRVQATPIISPRKYKPTGAFTPSTARRGAPTPQAQAATSTLAAWDDSSPESSPAPPQLRADLFSPIKTPRTPGVSVQTPGKGKQLFSTTKTGGGIFDDTDSEEEEDGFSPPKTIQFHIPQSKLLQTPAREASKRIVDDLLMTAGGDITGTTEGMEEDDSPSVVRRQVDMDDTF